MIMWQEPRAQCQSMEYLCLFVEKLHPLGATEATRGFVAGEGGSHMQHWSDTSCCCSRTWMGGIVKALSPPVWTPFPVSDCKGASLHCAL